MSLMAGFDLVTELSQDALLKLLKANGSMDGEPMSPPFDVELSLAIASLTANVHLLVNDVSLVLTAGTNQLTLVLEFDSGEVTNDGALLIQGLDGFINIDADVVLATIPQATLAGLGYTLKILRVDFSGATPSLQLSPQAKQNIANGLATAGVSLSESDLEAEAGTALTNKVRSMSPVDYGPAVTLPGKGNQQVNGFLVKPGMDGSLNDSVLGAVRYTTLDVAQFIGAQALGMFGTLLASTAGGNAAEKTSTAILPGMDISVSLSPDAFKHLNFCPGASRSMLDQVDADQKKSLFDTDDEVLQFQNSQMPGCCGPAGSLDAGGITMTNICCSLEQGDIRIEFDFKKSVPCADVTGSAYQKLKLSLNQNSIVSTVIENPAPTINADVTWYCQLAVYLLSIAGLQAALGTAIGAVINYVIGQIGDLVGNLLSKGKNKPQQVSPVPLGTFPNVTFLNIDVSEEGINLNGTMAITIPPPAPKSLALVVLHVTDDTPVELSSGSYHYSGNPSLGCPAMDFPYTEYSQQHEAQFEPIPLNLASPYQLQYFVEFYRGFWGYNQEPQLVSSVQLTGFSGSVTLIADTSFALPLEAGTQLMNQPVTVNYEISTRRVLKFVDQIITLSNVPKDGCYVVTLRAQATDADGVILEASKAYPFVGNYVDMGGGYQQFMANCLSNLKWVSQRIRTTPQPVGVTGDPPPAGLNQFINEVNQSGLTDAQAILVQTRLRFGFAFDQAVMEQE
jgi:hypothetical protein